MGIEMVVNLLVLVAVGTLAGVDREVEEGRFRASLRRLWAGWAGWGVEWLDTLEDIAYESAQLR